MTVGQALFDARGVARIKTGENQSKTRVYVELRPPTFASCKRATRVGPGLQVVERRKRQHPVRSQCSGRAAGYSSHWDRHHHHTGVRQERHRRPQSLPGRR